MGVKKNSDVIGKTFAVTKVIQPQYILEHICYNIFPVSCINCKRFQIDYFLEFVDLKSMFNQLEERNLEGILLDSFVAGANRGLLSSNVRVNKIISYDSSYGMVLREKMASRELQTCFNNFVSDKKGVISNIVEENTSPLKVSSGIIKNTSLSLLYCLELKKIF